MSLYDCPADEITFEVVSAFVANALATNLLTESLTLELKQQRSGTNVVEAVAAMANTDGGLVLVGMADSGELASRFAGVTQGQHLALVDQLRSLLSGQIPEVIPVRVPDSELLILVIRIDADQFEPPVVVGGRVLVRAPGQSVAADRERIISMSRPSAARADDFIDAPPAALPIDLMRFDLTEEEGNSLSLRVAAEFELPRRALESPWLSTAAKMALLNSLKASPIPNDLWVDGPTIQGHRPSWEIFQARSTSVRARLLPDNDFHSTSRPKCSGGVYLGQTGRQLAILLEVRVADSDAAQPITMRLGQLFEGLLGLVLTAISTLEDVATALGCGEPTRLTSLTGWLLPGAGRMLKQVLPLDEFGRHGRAQSAAGVFPKVRPGSKDSRNLADIVRAWITAALLDDAVFGFESELAAIPNPWWANDD